jgi:alkyl sulfatase BDS1-like metallo-beta-lactamase superfamily hydrolase
VTEGSYQVRGLDLSNITIEGDCAALGEHLGLLDPPDPGFAIVTP